MPGNLEFLIGLLDEDAPGAVAAEDFEGPHGSALTHWQGLGFIGREGGVNPCASCPHCHAGTPYALGGRYRCNSCFGIVEERHLLLWPVHRQALLGWVACAWELQGGVRRVEVNLWHLGSREMTDRHLECFFKRAGTLSEFGARTLASRRGALGLCGVLLPPEAERYGLRWVSLLEVLRNEGDLRVLTLEAVFAGQTEIRFDSVSGTLWAGARLLGEVPHGSREFFFIDCLARHLDAFVPYADLKRAVLSKTGGSDQTEEATFCHGLKRRIKKGYIPQIDLFLATTNKGDGYRLRGSTSPY
jgi:hypothetical protein